MTKWDDKNYVRVYEHVKTGSDSIANIAAALGVTAQTATIWRDENAAFRDAIAKGVAARGVGHGGEATFKDYVYQRLPTKLQGYWDLLDECDSNTEDGYRQIRMLTAQWGARVAKHLYIYAITTSHFNPSEALRKVGLTRAQVMRWVEEDPSFAQLAEELHWHKKNFFEGALIKRVAAGDTTAILFANKTQNRDRGYSEKLQVEHSGTVEHKHTHQMIPVEKLDLPAEVLALILRAQRAYLEENQMARLPGVVLPDMANIVEAAE